MRFPCSCCGKPHLKYRHYVSDVISVKTNQTVKKKEEEEEGGHLCCVSTPAHAHTCASEQVAPLLRCQDFKQVSSLVIQWRESGRVIYKLHLFSCFVFELLVTGFKMMFAASLLKTESQFIPESTIYKGCTIPYIYLKNRKCLEVFNLDLH